MGQNQDSLTCEGEGKERKKKKRSKKPNMWCKAKHWPQADQCPVSLWEKATLEKSLYSFIAEHKVMWHAISVCSLQVPSQGCVPSQLMYT